MKPGAGDDPFAEDSTDNEGEPLESDPGISDPTAEGAQSDSGAETPAVVNSSGQTQTQPLPYKYRRDSVKQGRNQQQVFLQSATEDLIEETIDRIEERFDENIYKTDVVEAMLVAGGEGTTPEAVLQRWGYGMKNQ